MKVVEINIISSILILLICITFRPVTHFIVDATDYQELVKDVTCHIFRGSVFFDDEHKRKMRDDWFCELDNGKHHSLKHSSYHLEGLHQSFLEKYQNTLSDGEAWIDLDQVIKEDENYVLTVLHETKVEFNEEKMRTARIGGGSRSVGEKTILLVKIRATGLNFFSLSVDDIREAVFGDGEGSMNSQFKACSHDQLSFKPAQGPGIAPDGSITVEVPRTLMGRDVLKIYNIANALVINTVGYLSQFDHVMFFIALGSRYGSIFNYNWKAFSYHNGRMSMYNSLCGASLSLLMHEVGHNFGLHHTKGLDGKSSDDTGYMGKVYPGETHSPLMCYNAAHSWELGWYEDRSFEVFPQKEGLLWSGRLYGVDDYNSTDANLYDYAIIIKITTRLPENYYVMYNTKKGINEGSQSSPDTVMIVSYGGRDSTLQVGLNETEEFRIEKYDTTNNIVVVKVCDKNQIFANAIVYVDSAPNSDWYDARGPQYDCLWYSVGTRCITDGFNFSSFGMVAMEACCHCLESFSNFTTTNSSTT